VQDRIADPWGARSPYDSGGEWPERVDEVARGGGRAREHSSAGLAARRQARVWITVRKEGGCALYAARTQRETLPAAQ